MDVLPTFLRGIRELVVAGDGDNLREWLLVEPDSPVAYQAMAQELRRKHPRGGSSLMTLIERSLPEEDNVPEGGSTPWPGFHSFMNEFLSFWRDADVSDLMDYHERFRALLSSCVTALKHPSNGSILIQTGVSYAQSMVKLVTVLNDRPDLVAAARGQQGGQEDGETRTFVDESCELIKEMFSDCARPLSAPTKKASVYLLAGMNLRLLFICGRPMVAWTLLPSLEQAPPLSGYPVAQRVTYLYYLGMVMFLSNHYPRARLALQAAYRQVPPHFTKQRRLILTYLIPANILCGRFPSEELLRRPEAATLASIFRPITAAIRKGNFVAFQHALAARQDWLQKRDILLPIMYRARPLLWRSLTRRVFLLTYQPPTTSDGVPLPGAGRKAVTVDLTAVLAAASYIQHLLEGYIPARPRTKRLPHTNPLLLRAVANSTPQPPDETTLVPRPGGPDTLRAYEGLLWGNMPITIEHVETVVMGLVAQGLMNGFVAVSGRKFAIQNISKHGGNPAAAGWPVNVAEVILRRIADQGVDIDYVPGWVV